MDVHAVAGVPRRYQGQTMSSLVDRAGRLLEGKALMAYRDAAQAVGNWQESGSWALVLSGPAGTSKSSLAAAALTYSHSSYAGWFAVSELARRARDGQGDTSFLDDVYPLVLDDLGSEYATYFSNQLFDSVVARCYDSMIPLIITTNMNKEQLASAYTARMVDRLSEDTLWVDTSAWRSFRGLS